MRLRAGAELAGLAPGREAPAGRIGVARQGGAAGRLGRRGAQWLGEVRGAQCLGEVRDAHWLGEVRDAHWLGGLRGAHWLGEVRGAHGAGSGPGGMRGRGMGPGGAHGPDMRPIGGPIGGPVREHGPGMAPGVARAWLPQGLMAPIGIGSGGRLPPGVGDGAHNCSERSAPAAAVPGHVPQVAPRGGGRRAPVSDWLRDGLDRLLALLLLGLLLPLMLAIGLAIALDSPGPILFRQSRGGLGGRRFTILKFRTMAWQPGGVAPAAGALGGQTARGDKRVTRMGALLRRTSLDELPQLINVLRGEMALVGPRPHAEELHAPMAQVLAGPAYAARLLVRPGMTGWAQINGARGAIESEAQFDARLRLDLYYIAHRSLWLDLRILLLTPWALIRAENAF